MRLLRGHAFEGAGQLLVGHGLDVFEIDVGEPGTLIVSLDGIRATIENIANQGIWADNTLWLQSGEGPARITEILPASVVADRVASDSSQTGPAQINGAVLNPGAAPSGATVAERQLVNDGETHGPTTQGYDEFVPTGTNYSGALNVDPGHTSQPITITVCLSLSPRSPRSLASSAPAMLSPRAARMSPFQTCAWTFWATSTPAP